MAIIWTGDFESGSWDTSGSGADDTFNGFQGSLVGDNATFTLNDAARIATQADLDEYGIAPRVGDYCIRVEYRFEDWGGNADAANPGDRKYRAEVSQPGSYQWNEGDEIWFAYSVLIPNDTNHANYIDSTALSCKVSQISLAGAVSGLECKNSNWWIQIGDLPAATNVVPIQLGQWHDFVYHIKFSETNAGFGKVWVDGNLVYNETGNVIWPGRQDLFFKFGVYRSKANYPGIPAFNLDTTTGPYNHAVHFYDEMRLGDANSSFEEVSPSAPVVIPDPTDITLDNTYGNDSANVAVTTDTVTVSATTGKRLCVVFLLRFSSGDTITLSNDYVVTKTYDNGTHQVLICEKEADGTDDFTWTSNNARIYSALVLEVGSPTVGVQQFFAHDADGWIDAAGTSADIGSVAPTTTPGLMISWLAVKDQQDWATGGSGSGITQPAGFIDPVFQYTTSANAGLVAVATKTYSSSTPVTGSWTSVDVGEFAAAGTLVFFSEETTPPGDGGIIKRRAMMDMLEPWGGVGVN